MTHRPHHEDIERDEPTQEDLEDALKQVLTSTVNERSRSENREPTREEMNRHYRLERWR